MILAAVGLAGLAVGGVFGGIAIDKNNDSKAECRPDDPSLCSAKGVDLREKASRAATVSTLGFAAGGALLAGGIVLYVTSPGAQGSDGAVGSLAPRASPSSLGLGLHGRF